MDDVTKTGEPMTLADHEALSQTRYEKLSKKMKNLKGAVMTDAVNVFQKDPMAGILPLLMNNGSSTAGAVGGGLGAGFLGGVLGGALLGNRGGLFGANGDGGGGAAAATLVTQNAIEAASNLNMARFDAEAQREIQAAVERTAAATQLASAIQSAALGVEIAKGQGEANTQVALIGAQLGVQVQKTAGDTQTQLATSTAALGVQTEKTAAANALAVAMGLQAAMAANATHAFNAATQLAASTGVIVTATRDQGDRIIARIDALNETSLNRQLTTAQNEIIELRGDREGRSRARETEINVTQNVNQQQVQLQQQQQQQTQLNLLSQICHGLNALQVATATNQSLIIGNTGAVVGGAQNANPTNVRA